MKRRAFLTLLISATISLIDLPFVLNRKAKATPIDSIDFMQIPMEIPYRYEPPTLLQVFLPWISK